MSDSSFYGYTPSFAGNIIFAAFFGATAIGHLYKMIKSRKLFFIPFFLGIVSETAGFAIRVYSRNQPNTDHFKGLYALQSVLIIIAPIFFAASMYMTISRLLFYLECKGASFIRPKWISKIFVLSDIICFLLQAFGSAMLASGKDIGQGMRVVMIGLGVQLGFFCLYVLVLIIAHLRLNKESIPKTPGRFQYPALFYALYVSCILIIVRSAYRFAEFAQFQQGSQGYVSSHEVFAFILDGVPMVICCIIMFLIHPSDVMVQPFSRYAEKCLQNDGCIPLVEHQKSNDHITNHRIGDGYPVTY